MSELVVWMMGAVDSNHRKAARKGVQYFRKARKYDRPFAEVLLVGRVAPLSGDVERSDRRWGGIGPDRCLCFGDQAVTVKDPDRCRPEYDLGAHEGLAECVVLGWNPAFGAVGSNGKLHLHPLVADIAFGHHQRQRSAELVRVRDDEGKRYRRTIGFLIGDECTDGAPCGRDDSPERISA